MLTDGTSSAEGITRLSVFESELLEPLVQALIAASPDCIKLLQLDGRLAFISEAGQCALGIKDPEAMLGSDWTSFWHGPDREAAEAALTNARMGGKGQFVGFCPTLDGKPKWWSVSVTPLRGASGEITRLLAVSTDVTEQVVRTGLNAVIEDGPPSEVGTWTWHLDEGRIEWSKEIFSMHGADVSSSTDPETLSKYVHPQDVESVREAVRVALEEQQPFRAEFRIVRQDGGVRWLASRAGVIRDPKGKPVRVIGATIDITEQKAVEHERLQLAAIVESSDDAMVSKTLDGIIRSWNAGSERVFGYTEEEAVGQPITIIIPPDRIDEERDIIAKLSRGQRIEHFESVRRRKDGQLIDVSVTISPLRDSTGKVFGASKVARDISARIRRERALAFLAKASDILSSSLDFRQTLVNVAQAAVPDFADWCAIDLVQESGELDRVVVAHVDPDKIELAGALQREYPTDMDAPQGLPNVLRTGQPEIYSDIPDDLIEEAAKDERHLELIRAAEIRYAIIAPLISRSEVVGAITFVSAIPGYFNEESLSLATDLARRAGFALDNARLYSEIRELNEKLEQRVLDRTGALQAAVMELEGFTYSVSHDLRTPLRAIVSTSRMLMEDLGTVIPDDAKELLERQAIAANKLGDLIDDLLRLSRINRHELAWQPVDMTALAQEVVQTLDTGNSKIVIQPDLHSTGDPKLLKLMLQNLFENALKFKQPNKPAEVEFGQRADGAFFVRDRGIGLDMRYAQKVFLPFERLHLDTEFPGTGIGLANVHRIVLRHGGRVWVESELGEGTTFFFTIATDA